MLWVQLPLSVQTGNLDGQSPGVYKLCRDTSEQSARAMPGCRGRIGTSRGTQIGKAAWLKPRWCRRTHCGFGSRSRHGRVVQLGKSIPHGGSIPSPVKHQRSAEQGDKPVQLGAGPRDRRSKLAGSGNRHFSASETRIARGTGVRITRTGGHVVGRSLGETPVRIRTS